MPANVNELPSLASDDLKQAVIDTHLQPSDSPNDSLSSEIPMHNSSTNGEPLQPVYDPIKGRMNYEQTSLHSSSNFFPKGDTNVAADVLISTPCISTQSLGTLGTAFPLFPHSETHLTSTSAFNPYYSQSHAAPQNDSMRPTGFFLQPQAPPRTECDDLASPFSGLPQLSSTSSTTGSPLSARQDSLGKALIEVPSKEIWTGPSMTSLKSVQEDYHFANKPTENAWQTLIMPLTQKCEALYHAAKALACFQKSHKQVGLKEEGLAHERCANQKLACEISGSTHISAVATSLLLASLEPWEEGIAPANKHLKGAKLLINEALRGQFRTASVGIEYTRLKVLYNTWLCLDVVFRLTCLNDRELGDFTEASTMIPSNSVYDNNLDPLGGCIPSLFPIIGQGAELIHWVRSGVVTSAQMVQQALKIWIMLEKWSPSAATMIARKRDPYSLEILRIAEAYRYSTFLFISQAVPELASPPSTFLAGRVLENLAAVHVQSKTAILQIFPLLAASGEVTDVQGRNWVIARWRAIVGFRPDLGIAIGRCTGVINEVWRRRDEFEARRCSTLAAMRGGFDQSCSELRSSLSSSPTTFTPSLAMELSSLQDMQAQQQPLPLSLASSHAWNYNNNNNNKINNNLLCNDDYLSTAAATSALGTATASTAATPITPITPATPATPVSPANSGSIYNFSNVAHTPQAQCHCQNCQPRQPNNPFANSSDIIPDCPCRDQSVYGHQRHHYPQYHQHQQSYSHLHNHNQHEQQQQQPQQQRILLDQSYTVCGQLHWVQVMKDWGWDGLCILPWE